MTIDQDAVQEEEGRPDGQRRSVIALAVDLAEHGSIEPRMATTSAILWPGRMCAATARFEKDAPRHFIR